MHGPARRRLRTSPNVERMASGPRTSLHRVKGGAVRLGETRSDAFQDVSHLLQHLPHRKRVPAGSSRCRHKPIPAYPETGREPARAVLRCLLGGRRRVGRAQAARHQHARPSRAAIGRPSLVPQTARPSLVPQTSEECGADQPGRISTAVQTSWLGEGSTPGWRSARQATSFGRSDVAPALPRSPATRISNRVS